MLLRQKQGDVERVAQESLFSGGEREDMKNKEIKKQMERESERVRERESSGVDASLRCSNTSFSEKQEKAL